MAGPSINKAYCKDCSTNCSVDNLCACCRSLLEAGYHLNLTSDERRRIKAMETVKIRAQFFDGTTAKFSVPQAEYTAWVTFLYNEGVVSDDL